MLDKHIPVTKEDLMDSVQRIIIDKKQEIPFKDNRPGKKWYTSFLKRHPTIAERVAQNLCTTRDNVTQEDIEKWFSEAESDLKDRNLIDIMQHPERIFNTDESAFFLNPKPGHVLARKGYASSGDDKENLTVLIRGNAAGKLAPTLVVYNKQTDVVNEESSNPVSVTNNPDANDSPREIQTIPVLSCNINNSEPSISSHTNCLSKDHQLTSTIPVATSNPSPGTNNPNSTESSKEIRTNPDLYCSANFDDSEPSTSTQTNCMSIKTSGLNSSNMENVGQEDNNIRDDSLPRCSHKTPIRTVNVGTSNYVIPSPFKRNLFWPETDETTKNKKREKVTKQKNRSESSDTESEIIYAESEESILSGGSELDDAPLSTLVPSQHKLSKGSYVIVLYEGQHFPGAIENRNKNEFEVSTMTFSTGNTYKWPEKTDKMWYQSEDIAEYIRPPKLINNKIGFYSVEEMQ
ncbi:unnamed protein product [Parnassius apollo]|uniref:(apollo) hypothetical protein n=1 Tax=Parnassius apollo TaxID=110799 RepID=A0A8S3WZT5_PARAO|nr:unnamed protein product [Parnassius apollo]